MDIEIFREHCLSYPQATEDFPFDETALVFRVKNHIFACIALDNPELAIEPAWHWNKKYWNQIWFNRDVDDEMIRKLVAHSYAEVVKKLPKKDRIDLETSI